MRRVLIGVLTAMLIAAPAASQEVVDNTASALQPEVLERLYTALRGTLADGYSAKLTFLYQGEQAVCGKVNAKNLMGTYVGDTRFMMTLSDNRITVLDQANGPMRTLQIAAFAGKCPTW